jgi:hypothetical protein
MYNNRLILSSVSQKNTGCTEADRLALPKATGAVALDEIIEASQATYNRLSKSRSESANSIGQQEGAEYDRVAPPARN